MRKFFDLLKDYKIIVILVLFLACLRLFHDQFVLVTSCYEETTDPPRDRYGFFTLRSINLFESKTERYFYWKENMCGTKLVIFSDDRFKNQIISCSKGQVPKLNLYEPDERSGRMESNRWSIPKNLSRPFLDFRIKCVNQN